MYISLVPNGRTHHCCCPCGAQTKYPLTACVSVEKWYCWSGIPRAGGVSKGAGGAMGDGEIGHDVITAGKRPAVETDQWNVVDSSAVDLRALHFPVDFERPAKSQIHLDTRSGVVTSRDCCWHIVNYCRI